MDKNNIKALFPEGVETITISKNDYDRLYGQLSYENIVLQTKIEKVDLFKLFLQERLLEHKDNIKTGINEFDKQNECEYILNKFIDFLKEDK